MLCRLCRPLGAKTTERSDVRVVACRDLAKPCAMESEQLSRVYGRLFMPSVAVATAACSRRPRATPASTIVPSTANSRGFLPRRLTHRLVGNQIGGGIRSCSWTHAVTLLSPHSTVIGSSRIACTVGITSSTTRCGLRSLCVSRSWRHGSRRCGGTRPATRVVFVGQTEAVPIRLVAKARVARFHTGLQRRKSE